MANKAFVFFSSGPADASGSVGVFSVSDAQLRTRLWPKCIDRNRGLANYTCTPTFTLYTALKISLQSCSSRIRTVSLKYMLLRISGLFFQDKIKATFGNTLQISPHHVCLVVLNLTAMQLRQFRVVGMSNIAQQHETT